MTTIEVLAQNMFGEPLVADERYILGLAVFSGFLSFLDNTLQFFLSWKKGPSLWQHVAPVIFLVNLHLTYILFPIVMILVITAAFAANFRELRQSAYAGWVLSYYIH